MFFFRAPITTLLCVAATVLSVAAAPVNRRGSGLKVSTDPTEWPTTAQLKTALKTKPNGAFFWSGRDNDVSVEERAAVVASGLGGTTLESALAKANFIMPAFDVRNNAAVDLWTSASTIFAQQASGEVFAVLGSSLRTGNVFQKDELPALKKNKAVTKVTKIDSKTGAKTPITRRDIEDEEEMIRDDDEEERDDEEELEARAAKKAAAKPAAKKAAPVKKVAAKPKATKAAAKPKATKAAAKPKATKAAAKPKATKAAAKPKATKAATKAAAKTTKAAAAKATKAAKTTAAKAKATKGVVSNAAESSKGCISHPVRCA